MSMNAIGEIAIGVVELETKRNLINHETRG
jgi:hypothetical protein